MQNHRTITTRVEDQYNFGDGTNDNENKHGPKTVSTLLINGSSFLERTGEPHSQKGQFTYHTRLPAEP